jgi:hypothetical protein
MQTAILAVALSLGTAGCHHRTACVSGGGHGWFGGGYRGACYSTSYSGCYGGGYSQGWGVRPSGQGMSYAPAYGYGQPVVYSPSTGSYAAPRWPIHNMAGTTAYGTNYGAPGTMTYGAPGAVTYGTQGTSTYGATGTGAAGTSGRTYSSSYGPLAPGFYPAGTVTQPASGSYPQATGVTNPAGTSVTPGTTNGPTTSTPANPGSARTLPTPSVTVPPAPSIPRMNP